MAIFSPIETIAHEWVPRITSCWPTNCQLAGLTLKQQAVLRIRLHELTYSTHEASRSRAAVQSVRWSPAPVAGPYLLRTSTSVLPVGAPFPFSIRRPWSQRELQSRLRPFPQVHVRRKAEDSLPEQFSPSDTGSWLYRDAGAWAKSIELKISNLATSSH